MRRFLHASIVLALAALSTACVSFREAGRFDALERQLSSRPPIKVSAHLKPFAWSAGARASGPELSPEALAGSDGPETQRLTESFAAELARAHVFRALTGFDAAELILEPEVRELSQARDDERDGNLVMATIYLLGLNLILGGPGSCGKAHAEIAIRARDPKTHDIVREWVSNADGDECAGLYYKGWPLGVALQKTASGLLDQIEHDAPELRTELEAAKDWRLRYALDGDEAVVGLERALGDRSRIVRFEALKVIASLEGASFAIPPVLARIGDESSDVRAAALEILAARRSELSDDESEVHAALERSARDGDPRISKSARDILGDFASRKEQPHAVAEAVTLSSAIERRPEGPSPPIVAVFDVRDEDHQLGAREVKKMTEYLEAQLAAVARWRVIPRSELLHQIQKRKAQSYRACVDEACQIELGKAAAAEKMLRAQVFKVGGRCKLTAALYDLKHEIAEHAATVSFACKTASLTAIDDLATKLRDETRR